MSELFYNLQRFVHRDHEQDELEIYALIEGGERENGERGIGVFQTRGTGNWGFLKSGNGD